MRVKFLEQLCPSDTASFLIAFSWRKFLAANRCHLLAAAVDLVLENLDLDIPIQRKPSAFSMPPLSNSASVVAEGPLPMDDYINFVSSFSKFQVRDLLEPLRDVLYHSVICSGLSYSYLYGLQLLQKTEARLFVMS